MGAFSTKFSTTLTAKLLMDPSRKFAGWNDGTDHLYHHAKFGGNRTTHVGMRESDVFHFLYNVPQITVTGDLVALLQQETASLFIVDLDGVCSVFSGTKSPFQWREQIWKSLLDSATIRAGIPEKIAKSEKMCAKIVRTTSTI